LWNKKLFLAIGSKPVLMVNEKEICTKILFESFKDNQSVTFVVKQDSRKDKRLKLLMEYSYFVGKNFGEVYLSIDQNVCAITIDPSKRKTTFKTVIWDLKLIFGCIGLFNVKKVLKREAIIKQNHPKEPFIHLWYIGVNPSHQGKGAGTKIMQEIIDNARDKPICLETSTVRNYSFYERLGFKCIAELDELGYKLNMFCR